jgi:hypothetical protein
MRPRLFVTAYGAIALTLAVPMPAIGAVSADVAAVEAPSAVPSGTQLWANRYNGPANDLDAARSVAVSPRANRVFITGVSYGSTSSADYATVAYNAANGRQVWVARYNGPGNYTDFAASVGVSADGTKVFVTGSSVGSTTSDDYATVAYDATDGTVLWVKRYNGSANGSDVATSLGVSADGTTVFVTGSSVGSTTSGDYATVAYNATNGTPLWIKRYNGPANSSDSASSVRVGSDGTKVFVSGYSDAATGSPDYATVAYNAADGTPLWVKRYNGPANSYDSAYSLGVSPDGSKVFVSGESYAANGFADYATVAYNAANGTQLWVKRYNGPGNSYDVAASVGVSPDGTKVFVTGQSVGSTTSEDYATVTYNATDGTTLWIKRYNGPANSNDGARSLGVSPDGTTVFVTGTSGGSLTSGDYATVAYNATAGAQQWVARYNGPANSFDEATSVGVSPSGTKLFVTGVSFGSASSSADYATVAYSVS